MTKYNLVWWETSPVPWVTNSNLDVRSLKKKTSAGINKLGDFTVETMCLIAFEKVSLTLNSEEMSPFSMKISANLFVNSSAFSKSIKLLSKWGS